MRPEHTHAARNQAFFGCLNPHQEINLEHRTAVYFCVGQTSGHGLRTKRPGLRENDVRVAFDSEQREK